MSEVNDAKYLKAKELYMLFTPLPAIAEAVQLSVDSIRRKRDDDGWFGDRNLMMTDDFKEEFQQMMQRNVKIAGNTITKIQRSIVQHINKRNKRNDEVPFTPFEADAQASAVLKLLKIEEILQINRGVNFVDLPPSSGMKDVSPNADTVDTSRVLIELSKDRGMRDHVYKLMQKEQTNERVANDTDSTIRSKTISAGLESDAMQSESRDVEKLSRNQSRVHEANGDLAGVRDVSGDRSEGNGKAELRNERDDHQAGQRDQVFEVDAPRADRSDRRNAFDDHDGCEDVIDQSPTPTSEQLESPGAIQRAENNRSGNTESDREDGSRERSSEERSDFNSGDVEFDDPFGEIEF